MPDKYEDYAERKQKEFYNKYPLCFPDGEPVCGFHCGYGWWPVLDKLCADITRELENGPDELLAEFRVDQIKEKFGGLRFYVSVGNDDIYNLIRVAENECDKLCEDCGKPGERRRGGWIKTRCDACQTAWEEERRQRNLKWDKR